VVSKSKPKPTPAPDPVARPAPEQVHLAFNAGGTMEVAWVDPRPFTAVDLAKQSGCAEWGLQAGEYPHRACSAPSYYSTPKPEYVSGLFYHSTVGEGVAPETRVFYRVGSDELGWSREFRGGRGGVGVL